MVISFIPAMPWTGLKNLNHSESKPTDGTGTQFTSDAVTGVTFFSDENAGRSSFAIESIIAAAPPVPLPEWMGRRPPVAGEWSQTFNEDFNGNAIDLHKWNLYSANYWDQLSQIGRASCRERV